MRHTEENILIVEKTPEQGENNYAVVPHGNGFTVGRITYYYDSYKRISERIQYEEQYPRPVRPPRPGRGSRPQNARQSTLEYLYEQRRHAGQVVVRVLSDAQIYSKEEAIAHQQAQEQEYVKREQEEAERVAREAAEIELDIPEDRIIQIHLLTRRYPRETKIEPDPYCHVPWQRWHDAARGDGASWGGVAETIDRNPEESFEDLWKRAQDRAGELSLAYDE